MSVRFVIAAVLLAATAARAEIAVVSTGHREADSFKRLSEYLTGRENPGRYVIARTNPESRDGFYVSLIADDEPFPQGVSTVRVHFVPPASLDVQTRDIAISGIDKRRLLVGLTGEPWSSLRTRPLAWKIELLDSTGAAIGSAQSFLWAQPNMK